MKISPFKIIVISIVLSLVGIASIPKLSIDLTPSYKPPQLTISYNLPGSSPKVVEQQATAPLENALSQVGEVKKLYSISRYHEGEIAITFDKHADIAYKKFEVASIIRRLYPKLHPKLSYPAISQRLQKSDKQSPLLIYQINSSATAYSIHNLAEQNILPKISSIEGVESVYLNGATPLQLSVRYDIAKLQNLGINPTLIRDVITEKYQVNHMGSYIATNGEEHFLQIGNYPSGLEELRNTIVKHPNIKLSDVAKVYMQEGEPKRYMRLNGNNAITITINGKNGENKIDLANQVKSTIQNISLPDDYQLLLDYDDSKFLKEELSKIYYRSGISIIILILFILLLYRDYKHLLVLFSGIIITLSLSSLGAWLLDIQVHLYTIAGITIAFGLIVDNSIVMMDHLHQRRNSNILVALFAASLTTISALLLIYFLPEEEKRNLLEFAQIIALSLAISLLVAWGYTPACFQLLFVKNDPKHSINSYRKSKVMYYVYTYYGFFIGALARFRKTFIVFLVLGFGLPVFLLPAKWGDHQWYNNTIGSTYYQENIRPISDKLLGGALRMFVRGVFEKSSYRKPEQTKLYVIGSLPFGNTVHQMNEVMMRVDEYLKGTKGVERFVTQVYSGQYGYTEITFLPDYESGVLPYQLKSRLIARSLEWGGVDWDVYGVGRGFTNSTGNMLPRYRVKMKGYNYDELENQADIMADELLAHKRIQKVNTNARLSWRDKSSSRYYLTVDNDNMKLAGVQYAQLYQSIKNRAKSSNPSWYATIGHQLVPVFIENDKAHEYQIDDVLKNINNENNKNFLIGDFGKFSLGHTANSIHKENRQYIRMVSFEYYGSDKFGNEYLDKVMENRKNKIPLGYSMEKQSWLFDWEKTKRQYGLLVILMIGIYFICSILFENLRQPTYIIVAIPISFIGLFLTFSLFDFYFDQGGYAAFIMLGGLVVNAAIFIIHEYNHYNQRSRNMVIKATMRKFVPIMLTLISTCVGLIPFVMGGQDEVFWFSLAAGTIGGLLFSIFTIFICLPVFLFPNSC